MNYAPRPCALVLMLIVASPPRASADTFGEYEEAFSAAVASNFALSDGARAGRRAAFVRRDFLAENVTKVLQDAQVQVHADAQGYGLPDSTTKIVLHTGGWDCSVNHFCGSCDGKKWLARAGCEIARGTCAAGLAPALAVCTAGKALDNAELGHIDFSGASLNVAADVSDFKLTVDSTLATVAASPSFNAAGVVTHLEAAVHLQTIVGIFTACVMPPRISAPDIKVSLKSVSVPVSASLHFEAAKNASDGLQLIVSLDAIKLDTDVDTGDIFSWVVKNPTALVFCTLPSIAGFVSATLTKHFHFEFTEKPIPMKVVSVRVQRDNESINMVPTLTPSAVGVLEDK